MSEEKYNALYINITWAKLTMCQLILTLLGLGLIKIKDVSANFNNPRPSLILNN